MTEPSARLLASDVVMRRLTSLSVLLLALAPTACAGPSTRDATARSVSPTEAAAEGTTSIDYCEDLADPTAPSPGPDGAVPTPVATSSVQLRTEERNRVQDLVSDEFGDILGSPYNDRFADQYVITVTEQADDVEAFIDPQTDLPLRVQTVEHTHTELLDAYEALNELDRSHLDPEVTIMSSWSVRIDRVHVDLVGDPEPAIPLLTNAVDGRTELLCLSISNFPDVDDAGDADWTVDPEWEPTPDATTVPLLVQERACASATPADGRIVVRSVEYGIDVVTADLGVIPLPGGQDCPGNPLTPFVLELTEPLDGRGVMPPPGQRLDPEELETGE